MTEEQVKRQNANCKNQIPRTTLLGRCRTGVIPSAARNLALVRSCTKIQGGIPRCARNDRGLAFGLRKGMSAAALPFDFCVLPFELFFAWGTDVK
jgi:hypothetical protein